MTWLFPLMLILPSGRIANYTLGSADVIIILWGVVALRVGRLPAPHASPIVTYIILFLTGWILATLNGPLFGIHFQVEDLVIFYRVGFCYFAWWLGTETNIPIGRIATSRVALLVIAATVGLSIAYTVLSYDQRLQLMSFFQPLSEELRNACFYSRFPGVNAPVNIYSFLPLCFLIFSFYRFISGEGGLWIFILSGILLLALGSRTSLLSGAFVILVILWAPLRSQVGELLPKWSPTRRRFSRVLGTLAFVAVIGIGGILINKQLVSDRAIAKTAGKVRTEDITYRVAKWEHGMTRVGMAPVLGIPEARGDERSGMSYYLKMNHPHNEFIQLWMWFGITGLAAHLYLLIKLVRANIRYRTGVVWLLFYFVVVVRMFMDTAFKDYLFTGFFFMIAGHNWANLQLYSTIASAKVHRVVNQCRILRGAPTV